MTTKTELAPQPTKVKTGKVRLSYAKVWEPDSVEEGGEKKYSASLIISKDDTATIDAINAAVEAAKQIGKAKWGGKIPAKLKLPLRDGDEEKPDDEAYANSYFLNATSKNKPGIIDLMKQEITDPEKVYSGCFIRASINFYPFDTKGNRGIACGLNNIQKLRDGDVLGNGRVKAEDDFDDDFVFDEDDDDLV